MSPVCCVNHVPGLHPFLSHGLRRGLHSFAALRLTSAAKAALRIAVSNGAAEAAPFQSQLQPFDPAFSPFNAVLQRWQVLQVVMSFTLRTLYFWIRAVPRST